MLSKARPTVCSGKRVRELDSCDTFFLIFLLASLAGSTANGSYLYVEHARNTCDYSFATDRQAS
jgi:hypothetical protein